MSQQDIERYAAAAHAMQSGVAMEMQRDPVPASPKHLRVGVNSALVDSGALAQLLIEKGLITRDEYEKALADGMEREARRYEERLSQAFGANIRLG